MLQVGDLSQTVDVVAAADLAESQTSSLGQVVDPKYIENLPLPNHSANALIVLSPGVVMISTVFEYLRNDSLDARNFFAQTKPPLRLNQFGGSLGGPIRKDKTHFFASWEETKQTSSDTLLSTVPTLAQRQGDFSGGATLYDPFNVVNGAKQPFLNNRIPADRIDPVARAASAFWPLPNRPGDANGANNYVGNTRLHMDRHILVGKLDHVIRDMDRLSIRYFVNNALTTDAGSYGIPISDPGATTTDVAIHSALLTYTHSFSTSLLNSFQVSLMNRKFIQGRGGADQDYAGQIGLTGVSAAAFPTLNVTGYALLGSQAIANSSIARVQTPITDVQVQDSISK